MAISDLSDPQLVVLVKQGKADAFTVLAQRYRGLLVFKAHRYFLPGEELDDFLQVAQIALWQAALIYQAHIGSFGGFAKLIIERKLREQVKTGLRHKHRPLNHSISLSQPLAIDPSLTVAEILPSTDTQPEYHLIDDENIKELLAGLTDSLSPMEWTIFCQLIAGDHTPLSIARALGMSYKQVDNAIQRIRHKTQGLIQQIHHPHAKESEAFGQPSHSARQGRGRPRRSTHIPHFGSG